VFIRFLSKIFTLTLLIAAYAPYTLAEVEKGRGTQVKHAFVVGIDKYDNLPAHAQLKKAVGDSLEMAKTLTALGFVVTSVKEPTRGEFVARWYQFLEKVRPGDTLAFVFSGHGIEIEGANYLLTRDVPRVRSGREGQLRSESVSFGQILTDVREREPVFSFVVLDACRDNPFEEGGRTVGGRRGLGRVEALEGTFVMFSAGAGQKALDRLDDADKAQTSVFTRTLLPLMREPGLSLLDMADQVGEQVRSLALSTGHKQTPAFYSRVIGGRHVCLAGCDVRSAPQIGAAEVVRICREVEQVNSLTTLGVLEAQHAGTPAGDCISARIGELKVTQAASAEAERNRVALLSKPAPSEAMDRTTLIRRLNRELARVGCDPGTSDGTWTATSREALQRFSVATKQALYTDQPTQAALDVLTAQKFFVCPHAPAAIPAPSSADKPPATTAVSVPPPKVEPGPKEEPVPRKAPATAAAPSPPTETLPAAVSPPAREKPVVPRAAAVKTPRAPSPPPAVTPPSFTTKVERQKNCRLETEEDCTLRTGVRSGSTFGQIAITCARKQICN
jgi:hypothetical protein